jgi:hypothetical protein
MDRRPSRAILENYFPVPIARGIYVTYLLSIKRFGLGSKNGPFWFKNVRFCLRKGPFPGQKQAFARVFEEEWTGVAARVAAAS